MRKMLIFVASALVLSTSPVDPVAANNLGSLSPEEQALEEFVRLVNGTWLLTARATATGTSTAHVKGSLRIDLVRQSTRMVGPRALGRFSAQERSERQSKPYVLESEGVWEVTIDRAAEAAPKANDIVFLVAETRSARTTDGACQQGIMTQTDVRLRLDRATHALLTPPARSSAQKTFRGRAVPAEWAAPVTFGHAAVQEGEVMPCSREFAELRIAGRQMHVTWDNGDRDSLKHTRAR